MPPAIPASSIDDTTAFPPPDRTVALNLGAAAIFVALVTVALVFDWVALKGVFVVGFLSVALSYLVLPLVRIIRCSAPGDCRSGLRPVAIGLKPAVRWDCRWNDHSFRRRHRPCR